MKWFLKMSTKLSFIWSVIWSPFKHVVIWSTGVSFQTKSFFDISISSLGLKGLEAGAVSAPDGLELFTYNHRAKRAVGEDGQKNNRGHLRPRRPYKARKNQKKQSDQKVSFIP